MTSLNSSAYNLGSTTSRGFVQEDPAPSIVSLSLEPVKEVLGGFGDDLQSLLQSTNQRRASILISLFTTWVVLEFVFRKLKVKSPARSI